MTKKQAATQAAPQQPMPPQPMPVVPQGYDPAMQAQYMAYQQPVNPNKGKAKWLTFEYAAAMTSVVVSTLLTLAALSLLFSIWANIEITNIGTDGYIAKVLGVNMTIAGTGLLVGPVLAVFLAITALFLFLRVSRTVPEREGYTSRTAYKVVTYGAMAALIAPAAVLIAKLVTVLIVSLLFIGVGDAGKVYTSLYAGDFLPYAFGLIVVGTMAYMVKQIIGGKNTSRLMSIILIAVTVLVLLATSVTLVVKARGGGVVQRPVNPKLYGAPFPR